MKKVLLLILAILAVSARAESFKSFWVTEILSGRTVGPVVNHPGNRFSVNGTEWTVMESKAGEINFLRASDRKLEGPFDLIEQRMFGLGGKGYVFTKVEPYKGSDPTQSEAELTQAIRAPAQKSADGLTEMMPERWVLAPIPSTNPAAHKAPAKSWTVERLAISPTLTGFIEPIHKEEYDWELGGLSASKKESLDSFRIGIAGTWNGFFGDIGLIGGGNKTGSLATGATLADLKVDAGSGHFLKLGYEYEIVIDGPWSAALGLFGSYSSRSADVSASTASDISKYESVETWIDGESSFEEKYSYGYRMWKHGATLKEKHLTATVGLDYDTWYWGMGMRIFLDCYTDTELSASIPVLDGHQTLKADSSEPVSLRVSGWYCPQDNWIIDAALTLGEETSLRLGTGLFF